MRRLLRSILVSGLLVAQPALAAVPNDPLIEQQWYLGKVKAFDAWDQATGNPEVVVAVLDTGVDLDHADIAGNLWTNPGEVALDGIDNDGNGFADDLHGWDFVDRDAIAEPDPVAGDEQDAIIHGTAIAGVIGAIGNNGEGVAGIAWRVRLMSVRILDNGGSGNSGDATEALRYAVKNGADVINVSFTGFEVDETFRAAVRDAYEAGVVIVAAVGNRSNGGSDLDVNPLYPVCFVADGGGDWVLGVAATTAQDTKALFSNYGASCTDIAAPGIDIFSVAYQDVDVDGFLEPYRGGWNGTSIAAPIVAGTVALLKGAYPNLSPSDMKTALQLSVDPVRTEGLPTGALGAGRVNVARAFEVGKALSQAKAPATVLPGVPKPMPSSSLDRARVVIGAGKGHKPQVAVYDMAGARASSFLAYAEGFLGSVRVAVGDVDGDGMSEIVTAPGPGGGPHVRVFRMDGSLKGQFFAFDTTLRSGLFVSTGDLDGDHVDEIIIGTDTGGGGIIKAFKLDGTKVTEFKPFDAEKDGGIRVASADLDGDGRVEIVAGMGPGVKPRVRAFNAVGALAMEVTAYADTFLGGLFVAGADLDGDGRDEVVTAPEAGGGPHVRAFDRSGAPVASFFAFDKAARGGARVGADRFGRSADVIVAVPGNGLPARVRLFDRLGIDVGGFDAPELVAGGWYMAVSSR